MSITVNNNNHVTVNTSKTIKEIKAYAEEHDIHVPSSIRKKTDIIAYVNEAMNISDEEPSVEMAPEVVPIDDEEIVSVGDLPQTNDKVSLEEDDSKWAPLMTAIKTAMIKQTLERNYQKLFFKDDDGNYISVARHFYGMVAACIKQLYPNTVEKDGRVPQRYLDQTVDEVIKEGLVWTYDHPKYHKVLVSDAKTLNGIYKEVYQK